MCVRKKPSYICTHCYARRSRLRYRIQRTLLSGAIYTYKAVYSTRMEAEEAAYELAGSRDKYRIISSFKEDNNGKN